MAKRGKVYTTKTYPVDALETSNILGRVEGLLTPELLVSRYLKNIPEVAKYTPDELKDQIELAMNDVELLTGLALSPVQIRERHPYDYNLYKSFIHFKVNHRPVQSVESVKIVSTDQKDLYTMPLEWLEMGLAHKGQINILPLLQTFGASNVTSSGTPSGALIFLQAMNSNAWLPAFWTVEYTYGLCKNGKLPIVVNQIVGMTAAISVLSASQVLNRINSQSLSADGISQSSSGQGPTIYAKRIEELTGERERLMQKIRSIFHSKYYLGNI
jgi:hypothetical protein